METAKGREMKFRGYLANENKMTHTHSLKEIVSICSLGYPDDVVWLQYTGLKDKNGVEIYEGDVCTKMISPDENNRAPKELYRGEITYHFGGFCLKVDGYYYPMSRTHGVVDVIGNIYQNPELLTPNN